MKDDIRQSDDRLRLTRLARGLSQGDLARAAGITRQAISGIESGRWSPSLDVALSVAKALDSTVEELFGTPPAEPPVRSRLAIPAGRAEGADEGRALLAEIAGDTIAFPLHGDHTMVPGFVPALATVLPAGPVPVDAPRGRAHRRGTVVAQRIAAPTPTLVVAGCDPALALLLGPLQRHDPPVNLAWWSTCNADAVDMLARGSVHAAAVHRKVTEPSRPAPGIEVVGFASWREGLCIAPRLASSVRSLADVVRQGLRIANREQGSEARRLLDAELARLKVDPGSVPGYEAETRGHLLAASAVASGLADAAVATEPAALAFGLAFVPWQDEVSELHIPRSLLGSTEVRALLDVLAGRELPAQLAALEGYDADTCGRILAA